MSPRRADPQVPIALVEAAAVLLAEEGPAAFSTRRLAAAAGTSTMAVYTHFGSMDDLVRAMVREGFARLHERMLAVGSTADPVTDVITLGYAYRANALDNPHLYAAMFGGSSLGGFSLTDEDRQYGRYTLESVVGAVSRCIEAERFRPADPGLLANQMWIALHGLVTLELGHYLVEPYDADVCFENQVAGLMLAAGDDPAAAITSVAQARERHTALRTAQPPSGPGRMAAPVARPDDEKVPVAAATSRRPGRPGRRRAVPRRDRTAPAD